MRTEADSDGKRNDNNNHHNYQTAPSSDRNVNFGYMNDNDVVEDEWSIQGDGNTGRPNETISNLGQWCN